MIIRVLSFPILSFDGCISMNYHVISRFNVFNCYGMYSSFTSSSG